jgi:probable HAF family extracellular repeat protein
VKFTRGLLTAVVLLTGFASAQVFTLTDIGPNITPTGINISGQVSAYGFCCGLFEEQALIWSKRSGLKELVSLEGGFSGALGINEHGDVVGFSANGADNSDAVLWPHTGGVIDIGEPFLNEEGSGVANAINNAGQVVGTTSVFSPTLGTTNAFLWSAKDGVTIIDTVSSQSSIPLVGANAISSDGTVVGTTSLTGQSSSFIWTKATGLKEIPIPPSYATGISRGYVVGSSACLAPRPCGAYHAFVWSRYGSFDLGTLRGDTSSAASAINFSLEIVGVSLNSSGSARAFFWKPGYRMMDLNNLVHARGWVLTSATAINHWGQIVGSGTLNGVPHGFLLTVIPKKK